MACREWLKWVQPLCMLVSGTALEIVDWNTKNKKLRCEICTGAIFLSCKYTAFEQVFFLDWQNSLGIVLIFSKTADINHSAVSKRVRGSEAEDILYRRNQVCPRCWGKYVWCHHCWLLRSCGPCSCPLRKGALNQLCFVPRTIRHSLQWDIWTASLYDIKQAFWDASWLQDSLVKKGYFDLLILPLELVCHCQSLAAEAFVEKFKITLFYGGLDLWRLALFPAILHIHAQSFETGRCHLHTGKTSFKTSIHCILLSSRLPYSKSIQYPSRSIALYLKISQNFRLFSVQ